MRARAPRTATGAGEGAPAPLFAERIATASPALRFGELRLLGQVLATYLVAETRDGLVLIDQHAAHERVLYEGLRATWRGGGVARQPLLITETVELAPDRVARVADAADALLRLGFEVEPFGERAIAVRAIPALLAGHDPVSLLRDLADQLGAGRDGGAGALRDPDAADALFASLACHAARRAGERLEPREQQALLDALDTIPVRADLSARPPGGGADRTERTRAPLRPGVATASLRRRDRIHFQADSVVVVAGPTAAGKSGIAIELALRFGGEIVNADSMQVYQGLDIGTAKPSLAERARVPHHLLDVVPPDVVYNAGRYSRDARAAAAQIHARGGLVFLTGGTGLYIRAFLEGLIHDGDPDPGAARAARARGQTRGGGR